MTTSTSAIVPKRARPRLPQRDTNPTVEATLPENSSLWERAVREAVINRYKYEPLADDNCRLLIVEPRSSRPSEIYVELKVVRFEDLGKPGYEYEALSYHWGNDKPNKAIHAHNRSLESSSLLQAQTPDDPSDARFYQVVASVIRQAVYKNFYIRPNLYQALEHLRDDKVPTRLWVDALCIDQDNRAEKKIQVSRMAEIYSRAQTVAVWLGIETPVTRRAMSFIEEVIDLDKLSKLVEDEGRVEDWSSLYTLMQSSWFGRRWVIQELALAKDPVVFCGSSQQHWTSFRDAISLFEANIDKIRNLFLRSARFNDRILIPETMAPLGAKVLVETINNIFRNNKTGTVTDFEPTQGLEYLVSTLSTFETADPRDTVHALRNIAKETSSFNVNAATNMDKIPPEPDYDKNLLQVYSDFVGWVAETSGSIDILCRQWALPEKEEPKLHYPPLVTLPTWIQLISDAPYGRQDRAARGRIHGDSFVGLPGQSSYNASHGRRAELFFGQDHTKKNEGLAAELKSKPCVPEIDSTASDTQGSSQAQLTDGKTPVSDIDHAVISQNTELDTTVEALTTADLSSVFENKLSKRRVLGKNGILQAAATITTDKPPMNIKTLMPNGSAIEDLGMSSPAAQITSYEKASLNQHKKGMDSAVHVRGIVLGTIQWCTDPIPDGLIPNNALDKLGWNPEHGQDDEQVPDKVWRTLVAERGEDGRNPPAWYYRACCYCLVHKSPNGHINTRELLDHPRGKPQPDVVVRFLKRVQSVTWNRRFIEAVSSDGKRWHGIGPHKAQRKDFVCILYGCSVPVILRQHTDEEIGEFYTFQGESYIYGVMDGEAVSSMTERELDDKTRTFKIL